MYCDILFAKPAEEFAQHLHIQCVIIRVPELCGKLQDWNYFCTRLEGRGGEQVTVQSRDLRVYNIRLAYTPSTTITGKTNRTAVDWPSAKIQYFVQINRPLATTKGITVKFTSLGRERFLRKRRLKKTRCQQIVGWNSNITWAQHSISITKNPFS